MVKHLQAAIPGAIAGAFIGLLVQYGELGDVGDTQQLVRRLVIGAAVWALGAISLSFIFEWAQGRRLAWGLGVVVLVAALTAALSGAGIVVLGFATRFALLQAAALVALPALGVWLGGHLALRLK